LQSQEEEEEGQKEGLYWKISAKRVSELEYL
jgi:hypothetical protein